MIQAKVRLKAGREKKIQHGYPWVQKGEILAVEGAPEVGTLVAVYDAQNRWLGIGSYNPLSRFPVRILTTIEEPIDTAFFVRRLEQALRLRQTVVNETNAYRLLFSEADGVPGLIVDRFADYLVVQVRTAGMERLKPIWLEALQAVCAPRGILERSEMESRREEGLTPFIAVLAGEVPEQILIHESGLEFLVPTRTGLKTGFYLDQRENRRQLARQIQPGMRVLDLFCYTGAFALYASRAGARVKGVDILPEAIELARHHAERNGLPAEWEIANAFEWLAHAAAHEAPYDWIILDPPAIAKKRGQKDSLRWAIWKLVYHALPLLAENGCLLVCSCAYQLDLSDMIEVVRLAATDRGCPLFLEDVSFQAPDHPFLLQFPESLYLKCLWLRKGRN
ncbi:MAG: class I SAM-dependent rRNA methyltransferase [Fimbriimonadales bacterium]|nr:class I SAM-dependent rRNA methyltransferase [Fimbriimonadales bacterium]